MAMVRDVAGIQGTEFRAGDIVIESLCAGFAAESNVVEYDIRCVGETGFQFGEGAATRFEGMNHRRLHECKLHILPTIRSHIKNHQRLCAGLESLEYGLINIAPASGADALRVLSPLDDVAKHLLLSDHGHVAKSDAARGSGMAERSIEFEREDEAVHAGGRYHFPRLRGVEYIARYYVYALIAIRGM